MVKYVWLGECYGLLVLGPNACGTTRRFPLMQTNPISKVIELIKFGSYYWIKAKLWSDSNSERWLNPQGWLRFWLSNK